MNTIHEEGVVRLPAPCPQCGCKVGNKVKVLLNSYSCHGCGAWLIDKRVTEPHHNID